MDLFSGAPGLTLIFLCIVAALAVALIRMFCALEQSTRLVRLRTALIARLEGR